jgi:chromosome segregation ATPase
MTMSGIGAGGDTLQALLNVIGDPKAHQARLDQLAASQAEVDAATAKLTALQDLIDTQKADLATERAALQNDVNAFASEKADLLAKASNFDQIAKDLDERKATVTASEQALANDAAATTAAQTAKQKELDEREVAVATAESEQAAAQAQIERTQKDLDDKLAKLKAITG